MDSSNLSIRRNSPKDKLLSYLQQKKRQHCSIICKISTGNGFENTNMTNCIPKIGKKILPVF
jgi:hypothetical protein